MDSASRRSVRRFCPSLRDRVRTRRTATSCRCRDEGIWLNDRWRLTRIAGVGVPLVLMLHPRDHYDMADLPDELAAELGLLSAHIVRHVEALPHISRAHVYRIGDGGAHLHVWFFARPEGQAQLYGSWLVVWDDLLPEYPADVADADAAIIADSLVASCGGAAQPPANRRTTDLPTEMPAIAAERAEPVIRSCRMARWVFACGYRAGWLREHTDREVR